MVCDCTVSARGAIDAYQFYPAVMHSHARLTYDEVWEALSVPDSRAAQRRVDVLPHLRDLYALYETLAVARGAWRYRFETTETRIVCDVSGRTEDRAAPAQRRAQAH
jgi:ribonuclease R